MNKNIGELIKEKRLDNKMTLKDISEATDLSIGYLSQLERGLTSIANDTLKKVAMALDVEMNYFMDQPVCRAKAVLRSYEREVLRIEGNSIIEYSMTNMADSAEMFPKFVEILPQKEIEESESYPHEGEEVVYVLEGILTLTIEDELTDLYPGDCAHYKSTIHHNWSNQTNKSVKFITVNTPNFLNKEKQ
ncbi:MAG: XRE family transcriptional regulator [Longicatena sp.]